MAIQKQPDDISVDRPTLPPFHPQRIRECQDALAGAVTAVMDNAEAAGLDDRRDHYRNVGACR